MHSKAATVRSNVRHATVIGAGIVGVCCGLYLQRDGWRVTLVDPKLPGEACSFGNAGLIATSAVPPISKPGLIPRLPKMLLDPLGPLAIRWSYLPRATPWLVRFARAGLPQRVEQIAAALGSLMRQVDEAYRPLVKSAGAEHLLQHRGILLVCETEAELRMAKWDRELRKRHGAIAEEVGPDEIRRLEPALAPIFKGGTYRPDVKNVVNPLRFTRTLVEDLHRNGGAFLQDEALAVERVQQGPYRVVTSSGSLNADITVIAAGAWSGRLTRALGVKVPLDTERGYHVMLADPQIEFQLPIGCEARGFYCTPMEDGLRVAGTVEIAGLGAPANYARADILLRHARRFYPDLRHSRIERWMGLRPSLPDSMPVISGIKDKPGLFLAFGHGHFGLTLAAVTGRAIADMAAGRPTAVDMSPFSVDRF